MLCEIGVDLVSINRFTQSMSQTPSMSSLIMHPSELSLSVVAQAGNFAAKEALQKCLRAEKIDFSSIAVLRDTHGGPYFKEYKSLLLKNRKAKVSITNELDFVIAFVVLINA